MSYVLTAAANGFAASGKITVTVPGGGAVNSVSIAYSGALSTDKVLLTFDLNGIPTVDVNTLPYIYETSDGNGYTAALGLVNNDPGAAATVYLTYGVIA